MRPACADRGCQPEEKWYALTGRVVDAKVEADGDIHLALQDADGKNAGTVSAEIPVGPKWCEIRQMVFGWTKQKFPFTVKSVHDLTIAEHVVTVNGQSLLRHRPRASGSFKPENVAERLRCVGNSSGNEIGSRPMKHWEIIAEIDIHRATTVSKIWQYSGLNPSQVRGLKQVATTKPKSYKPKEGEVVRRGDDFVIVRTNTLVKGDRKTEGFVAPYNSRLRMVLCGRLADSFIKKQNHYALEHYYPCKTAGTV